jgi:hypothetical protein
MGDDMEKKGKPDSQTGQGQHGGQSGQQGPGQHQPKKGGQNEGQEEEDDQNRDRQRRAS